ncbi:hypothetical protein [Bacillus glycinifermentans]|uniref:hypothetical protein n=1 Tax=Bacillus glycinifermentans TaxID=1664069 RepID=UPI001E5CC375|nr:hypothetical protein [Bacillus glycinifermentans]
MTIRFGLIGCGYISKKHLFTLSGCPEAELAAISDVTEERMAEAADYYQSLRGLKPEVAAIGNIPTCWPIRRSMR